MSDKIRLQLKDDYLFFDGMKLPDHMQDRNVAGGNVQRMTERMQEAVDNRRTFLSRLRSFIEGENMAGRKAGAILDFATLFLPFGRRINDGREAVKVILERKNKPPMIKALKRALTADGGGFIRVRNEDGEIDLTAIGASAIRLALVVGVLYVGDRLNILEQLIATLGL